MAQGILIIENKWMADLLAINLDIYVGIKTINIISIDELKIHIPMLKNQDLIIVDALTNEGDILPYINSIYKENNISCPCVVLNANEEDVPIRKYFSMLKDLSIPTLLKTAAKKLDITARDMISLPTPNYLGIDVKYFYGISKTPCSLFRRYLLNDDNFAFEILLQKGDDLSKEIKSRLKRDEIKKIFINSSNRLKFVNYYTTHILKSMKSSSKKEKFIQLLRDSMATNLIDGRAFSEVRDIADMCICESIEYIESNKNKTLQEFLDQLKANSNSYYVQSAQLISYIAFKILSELNWMKMSQKNSIVSAAFFSNILFGENDEHLAKIRLESELNDLLNAGKVTNEEHSLVLHHALNAAQLLEEEDSSFFADITRNVIREHHGVKKGIGFTRESESSLHSLSIIYLVAQDYCDKVLLDNIESHDKILEILSRDYKKRKLNKSTNYLKHLEIKEKPIIIST